MSEKSLEPCGVVAVMVQADGNVIATAADFNRQGYGGFKLWEAQRIRARDKVMRNTVNAYCSSFIADAIDNYLAEQIVRALTDKKGHKIVYRAVGYDDEATAQVERW